MNVPDHKVAREEAEWSTFAIGVVNEQAAGLFAALLYKIDGDTDNLLLGDGLYGILGPIKCQECGVWYFSIILYLLPRTVDDMRD